MYGGVLKRNLLATPTTGEASPLKLELALSSILVKHVSFFPLRAAAFASIISLRGRTQRGAYSRHRVARHGKSNLRTEKKKAIDNCVQDEDNDGNDSETRSINNIHTFVLYVM